MLIPLATPAMFRTMDMPQVYDAGGDSLQGRYELRSRYARTLQIIP
jgi:hypothetical protein